MVLTDKQKEDLNKAILEYLENNNYKEASLAFQLETNLDYNPQDNNGITDVLEKKWISIIRLQKKVLELEQQIQQQKEELQENHKISLTGNPQEKQKMFLNPNSKYTLEGHRGMIQCVSLHYNYNLLASASEDCTIKIWDYDSGSLEKTLKGHTQSVNYVKFHEKYLASASSDLSVKIWEIQSFSCFRTLNGHDHSVSGVDFINGDMLISCSRDNSIKVWEIQTGYCKKTLNGHEDWVRRVKVDVGSQLIASAGCDNKIIIWNINNLNIKTELSGHEHVIEDIMWLNHLDSKKALIQSEKGQTMIQQQKEGNKEITQEEEGNNNGLQQKYKNLVNKEKEKNDLVYENYNFLVSCSRDKIIRVWSVELEQCLFELIGHDNWVRGLAMHHSCRYIYSVSDDKSIRVWDLQNMKQFRKIDNAHNHFVAAIDSNIKYTVTVTGSVDNQIKVWTVK